LYSLGIIALQGHCSTISLYKDDELVFALSEERLSRIKEDSNFPEFAIKACLDKFNLKMQDIDSISFAWNPWSSLWFYLLKNLKHTTFDFLFGKRINGKRSRVKKFLEMIFIRSYIKKTFGHCPKLSFKDHHTCHSLTSIFHSGFTDPLSLVIDGYGDRATISLYKLNGRHHQLLQETFFPDSLGLFYSMFTQFLGFTSDIDEYKFMGLSSYGEPSLVDKINQVISFDENNFVKLNLTYFTFQKSSNVFYSDKLIELLGDPKTYDFKQRTDLAKSVQVVFSQVILKIIKNIKQKYGQETQSICFSGGVFQNCVLNKDIRDSKIFKNVFFTPLCSDLGTAIGACLSERLSKGLSLKKLSHLYLGSSFSDTEIEKILKFFNLNYTTSENLTKDTAKILEQENIIGWFQGASELGYRALGARSILADPRKQEMKDKVNHKIKKRESFRPFAPATTNEFVHKFFEVSGQELGYMIETVDAKKEMANEIAAVVHVDSSSRVQVVSEQDNKIFYDLLLEFEKQTGVGVLLNTSFNIKDEPIVNSPQDALICFARANLDYLVMGRFIIPANSNNHFISRYQS